MSDATPDHPWRWDARRAQWVPAGDWAGGLTLVVLKRGSERWRAHAGGHIIGFADAADQAKCALEAWVARHRAAAVPSARRDAARRFRLAAAELRAVLASDPELSLYVAGDTLCLMRGPSHDVDHRPLRDNVVETEAGLRISGGDW